MSERIIIIQSTPAPKSYEAWLYLIKIWKTSTYFKLYGGYHVGIFDPNTDNYFHSSEDIEMRHDFAWADKIEYEILDYGTKDDMGYKEKKMLTDANAADPNSDWHNRTNGGGKYGKGYKGMGAVTNVWGQISWVADDDIKGEKIQQYMDLSNFPVKYARKEELKEILKIPNPYQPRKDLFKSSAVLLYSQLFDTGKIKPNEWKPCVFLMPKKGTKKLPYILGGNLSAAGNSNSKHGDGLFYIAISYEIWSKISNSNLRLLGNRLNPRYEIERDPQNVDDAAAWIVGHCEENNLYRQNFNDIKVLDTNHASITNELRLYGKWKTKQQQKKCRRVAQTQYEDSQAPEDHILDFSDNGLRANKSLNKEYQKRKNRYLHTSFGGEGGEFDLVYKMSGAAINPSKVIMAIHKANIFRKKVLVWLFFANREAKQEWINSIPSKDGSLAGEEAWKKFIKYHFSNNEIETKILPLTEQEAYADGWFDVNVDKNIKQ